MIDANDLIKKQSKASEISEDENPSLLGVVCSLKSFS